MIISVVSPVYDAERMIHELVSRIKTCILEINCDYEIILIEDGSQDNSWSIIKEMCYYDKNIKAIKLSRNFGQHHAITAGLDIAIGDYIVVMDCDLQDRPEEILNLYNEIIKDYDIVFARRMNRQDGVFKKIISKLFYLIYSYLSGIKQDGTVSNFGIYSRNVIDTIKKLREPMRAFSAMVVWVGFNKTYIDVSHSKRFEGKSTYNFNKLINLGIDIAISYSDKPLKLALKLGVFISVSSFLFALYNILLYYSGIIRITGYASLIVSIWFLCGLIISFLGIFGLYLGKIFEGIKGRPLYIVKEKLNYE